MMAAGSVVDNDASRGQFLLNGSADFLTVPTISESLAGRAAFLELWPLTQGEMHHAPMRCTAKRLGIAAPSRCIISAIVAA